MSIPEKCFYCDKAAPLRSCGLCTQRICKKCLEYIDTHSFSFLTEIPAKLVQGTYCKSCFIEQIAPAKTDYDSLMDRASEVYYLSKAYPGHIPVLRRHTKRVSVEDCDDRRETIMRLAFKAAELGLNAIIEAEVDSSRAGEGKFKNSRWRGSALPAQINGEQLERSSLRGF